MKIKDKFDMNFRMLQFQAEKKIHIVVSTFRETVITGHNGTESKCQGLHEEKLGEVTARLEHS
jgi:hypothetical protein